MSRSRSGSGRSGRRSPPPTSPNASRGSSSTPAAEATTSYGCCTPSPAPARWIASGIDLALHLVALDHGPAVAARTARALVVPARRNGSAPQTSAMLRHRDHLADVVHRAQDVLDERFTEPLPLDELAVAVGVSTRTLTRRFTAATDTTPLRYQQELRLELVESLLAAGWTQEAAAHEAGFKDARMLRTLRAARTP